jgi:hypothetical protein
MKRSTAVATIIAALWLIAMPVAAQEPDYPPDGETVTVSDPTPAPGQAITITASGFLAGETVVFTISTIEVFSTAGASVRLAQTGQTTIGSDVADANGTASVTFNAPTAAGRYLIQATGQTSGAQATTLITVGEPADEDDALPFTGSNVGNLVVPAVVALVAGALLIGVASTRRRRHSTRPTS